MSDLIIPKTSFDTLNRVIIAYYLTHSNSGINVKDVAFKTGYVEAQISKSNKFLIQIKLLIKDGKKFKLSNIGLQYAEFFRNNDLDNANEILYNLIREYEAIRLITNFVEIYGSVSKKDLIKRIAGVTSSNVSVSDHKVGINCLIDIIVNSGILSLNNDIITMGVREL